MPSEFEGTQEEYNNLILAEHIIKSKEYGNLTGSDRRICIHTPVVRKTPNDSLTKRVIEIDFHVPSADRTYADQAIGIIKKLFHNKHFDTMQSKILYYDNDLDDLPTAQNFYCAGIRFWYNQCIV